MSRDLDLTDCRVLFLEADLCMADARDRRPSSIRLCLEALRSENTMDLSIKYKVSQSSQGYLFLSYNPNLGQCVVSVCIRAEKMFGTKYFLQTQRVEPGGGVEQPCAPSLQDCRIYRNPPYGKLNFAVIALGLSKFPVLDFAFFLSWGFDSII